jgi:hypothetical protein
VRRAAEEDVLRDREGGRGLGLLRDEGDETRESAAAEVPHVLFADAHVTLERHQAGESAERGRLPGAVRPDQRRPAAGRGPQREPAHRGDWAEPDPEVARLDHLIDLDERRTTAKNGAPRKAVITPIDSSAGDCTVRARTSARTRKPAPARSDRGMTAR